MQTQVIDRYSIYLAAILLGVLALWVVLALAAAAGVRLLRGRARLRAIAVARRTMPRWLFRLTVGATVAGIALAPAAANAATRTPGPGPAPAAAVSIAPRMHTPTPPKPSVPTTPAMPTTPSATSSSAHRAEVTVQAGDSLWRLAAEQLGPSASPQQIAHEWPKWWAANRAVIGDDPDLIQPGQHLVAPTGDQP